MTQFEELPFECRVASVDMKPGFSHFDFCAFEFPCCEGCQNAGGSGDAFDLVEDPTKPAVLGGWLYANLRAPS
jgi:hypothetical protein